MLTLLVSSCLEAAALSLSGLDWTQPEPHSRIQLTVEKPTVLIFFSNSCPCSKAHEPVVDEIREEFERKGVVFFGIVSGKNEKKHLFMSRTKWNGKVLRDENAVMAKSFAVQKTPHVLLFDASGNLCYSGGIDDSSDPAKARRAFLKDALTHFVKGKPIAQKFQRVLGCHLR